MVARHATRFLHLALAGEIGLGLLAAVLGWWLWDDPLSQPARLDGATWLLALQATLLPAAAVTLMSSMVGRQVPAFERLHAALDRAIGAPLRDLDLAGLAALSLAAGVAEELLFRGVLQTLWGLWPAALVFGLAHAVTPTYFVLATVMGAYLGWLFADSGNLALPMLVHALYDLYALWLVRRRLRAEAAAVDSGREHEGPAP